MGEHVPNTIGKGEWGKEGTQMPRRWSRQAIGATLPHPLTQYYEQLKNRFKTPVDPTQKRPEEFGTNSGNEGQSRRQLFEPQLDIRH